MSNLFVQNGKDSVILITNDVGNKERKDDESMGALVALGVFTAIAIVAVIVVVLCGSRDCGVRYGFDQRRRGIRDGTVKENFI